MVLEAPLAVLRSQRGDDLEWLPATVRLRGEGADAGREFDVEIRARGNFRRKRETCDFPPFWINFKKDQVEGTALAGLDRVKVVAHCRYRSFEPFVHKEFLIYKTYNILTDQSFRVRLASIEYVDLDGRAKPRTFDAFFIEDVDSLAERMGATQVKDQFILPSRYDELALCRAEMFQFFVGNTDFGYFASEDECCHNGKAFAPGGNETGLIPVPYDFDLSGLVNVPYADVDPNLPIHTVRERLYRGVAASRENLQDTLNLYLNKKAEILELWENADFLDNKHKARAVAYIEKFYDILEDHDRLKREIIGKLRNKDSLENIIQETIVRRQNEE